MIHTASVHRVNLQELTAVSDFLKNHGGARETGKEERKTMERKGELEYEREVRNVILLVLKIIYLTEIVNYCF